MRKTHFSWMHSVVQLARYPLFPNNWVETPSFALRTASICWSMISTRCRKRSLGCWPMLTCFRWNNDLSMTQDKAQLIIPTIVTMSRHNAASNVHYPRGFGRHNVSSLIYVPLTALNTSVDRTVIVCSNNEPINQTYTVSTEVVCNSSKTTL